MDSQDIVKRGRAIPIFPIFVEVFPILIIFGRTIMLTASYSSSVHDVWVSFLYDVNTQS